MSREVLYFLLMRRVSACLHAHSQPNSVLILPCKLRRAVKLLNKQTLHVKLCVHGCLYV